MRAWLGIAAAALMVASAPATARAQAFFYPPASGSVALTPNVEYADADASGRPRVLDVYRPPQPTQEGRAGAPAFIFFTASATPQFRDPWAAGWGRAAAANALVGIVPDIRPDHAAEDLDAVLAYVTSRARDLGIDPDAVALCAGSGNVATAFPLVEDPRRTRLRAAVMLYASAEVAAFRRDLPVLIVRAGLDRPDVNREVAQLAVKAMMENAPVTVINHASGHHAFETVDDNAATVSAIDAVFAFVKRATGAAYQSAARSAAREVSAAGAFMSGNYAAASAAYASLVSERPGDARLRLSYGESLLAERRYAEACAEFARLKGAALGPRDLGVPAARACALSGDAASAIAWLRTIPKRFLPPGLEHDAAFAALSGREEFRALFRP